MTVTVTGVDPTVAVEVAVNPKDVVMVPAGSVTLAGVAVTPCGNPATEIVIGALA
jgi:hypothetical protein